MPAQMKSMTENESDQLQRTLVNMRSSDLQTLLLSVFRERTNSQRPRDVRQAFERRFCLPSDTDPKLMHEVDGCLFDASTEFELIELSPLAPLGVCTAVGPCDPMKIVATIRNLEVASDPSNVLAVAAANRRRDDVDQVHFGASHRAVRAQALADPRHRAHFRLYVLCSMFPSRGSGRSETDSLLKHLRVYQSAVERCGASLVRVSVSCSDQPWETVRERIAGTLGVPVDGDDDRIGTNNYYQGLSFKGHVRVASGDELPLVDGGFTSWGAQYLSRAKERTLISAIGTEMLATCMERP